MIKQLIFDCDGVLVDSEIIAAQVMVDSLNQYGIPITTAYYLEYCTGKTFTGIKSSLSDQFGIPLPEDFTKSVTEKMEIVISDQLNPVVGVSDLLDQIISRPKAVVSNSDLDQINVSLTQTRISHHFGLNIFSAEQVVNAKPSPEVYLYAADILKVQPKDCLVVEDSISGATSALAAGMNVVGFLAGRHITEGHDDRLRNIGVEKMAYSSRELKEIIDRSV